MMQCSCVTNAEYLDHDAWTEALEVSLYAHVQIALSRYTSTYDTHSVHRTECNSHAEQISIGKNGYTIGQNAQSHAKQIAENTQPAGTEKGIFDF